MDFAGMMESGEHIIEPGEDDDEPDWESLCPQMRCLDAKSVFISEK